MLTRQVSAGPSTIAVRVVPAPSQQDAPVLWPSLGEYPVYDAFLYYLMTNDHDRNQAFQKAIRAIAPGQSVVDIGTGQDANWAVEFVESGARQVYAIEEIEPAHAKAAEKIRRLGLEERVQLLYGPSLRVGLPARVDVCVSEIIGAIASAEGAAAVLRDARERFLNPGGRIVPQRCTTRIAAASLPPELHADPGFTLDSADYLERVFEQVGHPFDPRLCIANFPLEDILSDDGVFETLDFTGNVQAEYDNAASLRMNRDGRLDGFLLWINLWCIDGDEPIDSVRQKTSWLPVFLPVFYPGIEVARDDCVEVICRTRLSDDLLHPDYDIEGRLVRTGGPTIRFALRMPHHDPVFRQNRFYRALFPSKTSSRTVAVP
jgi:type I protein arginine methyltransferase